MTHLNILVTGANGFVGTYLCSQILKLTDHIVYAAQRNTLKPSTMRYKPFHITDIQDLKPLLSDIDVIIHLAARVHQMSETEPDPLTAFRTINTVATTDLARAAVDAGVQRFIYLSSIKVNGENTEDGRPFTPFDVPNPQDAYAVSKFEAESSLRFIGRQSNLDIVIIRPPLIYGPGVKANFKRLINLTDTCLLLPFGALHNCRSFVGLPNLADLIIRCISHPHAANQTLLVSDGIDISISYLLKTIARSLQKPLILAPIPIWILQQLARVFRKSAELERLTLPLQVDISYTKNLLDWSPPYLLREVMLTTISKLKRRPCGPNLSNIS